LIENYNELLDINKRQSDLINKQNDTITKLLNENLEKENMIKALMEE